MGAKAEPPAMILTIDVVGRERREGDERLEEETYLELESGSARRLEPEKARLVASVARLGSSRRSQSQPV